MRRERFSVRLGGGGLVRLGRIAAAMSGDGDPTGWRGPAIRRLIGEALTARVKACARGHVGPIEADGCGHCGAEVP